MNNFPPPALSGAGEIDAGRVELCGAQGRRLGRAGTQGYQKVPRRTKVPRELETYWVGGGALSGAAHINLKTQKYTQREQTRQAGIYVLNE